MVIKNGYNYSKLNYLKMNRIMLRYIYDHKSAVKSFQLNKSDHNVQ